MNNQSELIEFKLWLNIHVDLFFCLELLVRTSFWYLFKSNAQNQIFYNFFFKEFFKQHDHHDIHKQFILYFVLRVR